MGHIMIERMLYIIWTVIEGKGGRGRRAIHYTGQRGGGAGIPYV